MDWVEYNITYLAEILNHQRVPLSSMQRVNKKGIYPYYGASGVIDYIDEFIFDGEYLLISEDGENLKTRQTPIAFIAKGQFWVNNHAHIIKGKYPHTNKLLAYYFANIDIKPYLSGSVQPKLNKASLCSIPINLPSDIDEQKRIADVLSALDDKIEVNNKINENLEAQAQAIFKQWFVDEANEGWEEKPIGYFGNVVCGKTPAKNNKEYFGGEIPFIKIPDMHGNTFVINTNDTLTRLGKLSQENKTLPPYSICVSCIATVGLVSMNIVEGQTNQQINSIIPCKEEYRYYLYLKLSSMYEYLNSIARGGTATLNLNTTNFMNIKISFPNEDKLIAFHEVVSPIFKEILNKMEESKNLSEIRDSLLPKLMSGEVRV